MSLMFAKQFSEAGASTSSGRKGGRGKGSGMMAKSKRGKRDQEEAGDTSSGGLFNMEGNGPYRTHMLFPGRKEEEGASGDPRRSSGSPGFMKQMMSWGKRPSDPRGVAGQEMQRYRATPTRTESELDPLTRKTVSFEDGVISPYPAQSTDYLNPGMISPYQGSPYLNPNQGRSSPYTPSIHSRGTNSPYTPTNQVVSAYPNPTNRPNGQNPYYPYSEPFRESDYASFGKFLILLLICIYNSIVCPKVGHPTIRTEL